MSSIRVEEQPDHCGPGAALHRRNPISRHRRSASATAFEEIVSALPKEFLETSTRRAALGLLSSVAVLAVGYWLTAISPWFFLPLLWALLGAAYAGVRRNSAAVAFSRPVHRWRSLPFLPFAFLRFIQRADVGNIDLHVLFSRSIHMPVDSCGRGNSTCCRSKILQTLIFLTARLFVPCCFTRCHFAEMFDYLQNFNAFFCLF